MHPGLLASIHHVVYVSRWLPGLPRRLAGLLVAASLSWLLLWPARAQRLVAPWQPDPVLSSLLVQQLLFSPAGYAWVATDAGVRRYDGYAAVPLAQFVQNNVAPPPGYSQLVLDATGTLWIGAEAGLFRFVPRTGQLTHLVLPGAPGERPHVTALWYDGRTRRLWVGYGPHQLGVLDPAAAQPRWQPAPAYAGPEPVVRLAPGSGRTVWVTATHHLLVLAGPARRLRQLPLPPESLVPVPGTWPQRLVSPNALYELDETQGRLRERQRWLPDPQHTDSRFAPQLDSLARPCEWLVAGQRIRLRWPAASQALPQVQREPAGVNPADAGTEPQRLYRLQRDPTGLWWAFSPDWRTCYRQVLRPTLLRLPLPVALPSVRCLTRLPDGRLLVGSYTGTFLQRPDSSAAFRPLPLRLAGQPWAYAPYHALTTRTGQVLLALTGDGVGALDPATGELRPFTPTVSARTLLQDSQGRLWGGGDEGLFEVDAAHFRLRRYPATGVLRGCAVRGLAEDRAGQLWLATARGAFALDPASGRLRHYGPTEAGPSHLPTADMTCVVAQAPDGHIWLGTREAGLLALDPRRGVVHQLAATAGLPDAPVASLLPGPDGALWAGTYAGLVRYAPASDQLTVYGLADGLTDLEFNQQAALREADGTLWFGGIGGAFRIRPTRLAPVPARAPRLLLTQLTTTGQLRPVPEGAAAPPLRLAGVGQELRLDLALDAFRDPAQARFYYRLQPAEAPAASRLAALPTGHQLRLHASAAGDYELAVWGQAADGRRSAARLVRLHVARPWWQHPATLAGAALLLLGLGALVPHWRSRRALREARLRTRIAADLHDEVGALLTRVSLRAELVSLRAEAPVAPAPAPAPAAAPSPDPDLTALLADSRAALATMRDVVWSIDAGADSVGALRDRLREHLTRTAEPAGLATALHVWGLADALPLAPQLRQHLYLLAKEAVTNVVRHAPRATTLTLTLARQGRGLVLTVLDDGAPSPAPPGAGGMGLRTMQQRAAALGGQLTVGPRPDGPGWRVQLMIPAGLGGLGPGD